jgi:hypothetical protein
MEKEYCIFSYAESRPKKKKNDMNVNWGVWGLTIEESQGEGRVREEVNMIEVFYMHV